jgi:hypothetical protein
VSDFLIVKDQHNMLCRMLTETESIIAPRAMPDLDRLRNDLTCSGRHTYFNHTDGKPTLYDLRAGLSAEETWPMVSVGKPDKEDPFNDAQILGKRVKMKFGRLVRQRFPDMEDWAIADICDACNAVATTEFVVEELVGKDIVKAYQGCLGGRSCMTGGSAQYTQVYADNPSTVSLLLVRNEDRVLGRALCWSLDSGRRFIDRVYGGFTAESALKKYALQHGAYTQLTAPAEELVVTVNPSSNGYWPYMDTFAYMVEDGSKCRLSCNCPDGLHVWELDCTDGGPINGDYAYECHNCGAGLTEDTLYSTDDGLYCECCYDEMFAHCYDCGTTVFRDDAYLTNDSREVCPECRADNYTVCDDCGELFADSEVTEGNDGKCYCDDCLPEEEEDDTEEK